MSSTNQIGIRITGDASGLQNALREAGRDVDAFGGKVKNSGDAMSQLATGLKSAFVGSSVAVGLIVLKNTVLELTSAMVQAQIQADKLRNGLNFAVGRGNSGAELQFIRDSAKSLGLEFVSAAEQYTKLAAAARGTSLEGQKTRDLFLSIAQASTVMGLSAEQTEGALLAVTQMISKGKIQAEELRGQLGERLPGAFQIAARAMGVTTGELDKMLSTGQVLSTDFLPKFTRQLSMEVAPEVEAASQSMQASVNRMSTAWTDFKKAVAGSGVSDSLIKESAGLANYLTVLTEAMERAKASGAGTVSALSAGLGTAIARVPFDVMAGSANLLNEALNKVSLGALQLRTDINLLPQSFETNAQKAAMLGARLKTAQADLAQLQAKLALSPDNIYLKSETYQAYLLVEELRKAKAAKDALTSGGAGRGRVNPETVAASLEQEAARQSAYEAAMTTYATDGEKLNVELAKQKALLGDLFTPELEARIRKHFIKPTKQASDDFARLATEIAKADDVSQQYLDSGDKLQESDKFRLDTLAKIETALRKGHISLAQSVELEARMNVAQQKRILVEKELLATKQQNENLADNARTVEDAQKAAEALEKQVEAERQHVAQIGLTKEAVAALEAAKLEDLATSKDRLANFYEENNLSEALTESYRAQAKALRDMAKLKTEGAAKDVAVDEAKKAADAWQRAADQIEQSITDALMRGFESGKGFIENLRDTIVNTFKTMVLRPVVSAIVNPVAQGAASMLVGGSAAAGQGGASGGGMGIMDAISASNTLSTAKAWLTDFSGGVASQVSKFGNYLSSSTSSSISEFGNSLMDNATSIGKYAEMAGNALGYLNAAVAASEGKWGQAVGAAAGTWFFGPIGGAIGGAIGSAIDNAFGGGVEYATARGITGTFSGSGFSGRSFTDVRNDGNSGLFGLGASGASSKTNYGALDNATTNQLSGAFAGITAQTAAFAKSLGLSAGTVLGFSKAIRLQLTDDAEANKKAIAELFAGIADEAAATVLDPQYIREGETAASTLARLATNLQVVNGAFDTLGQTLLSVSQAGGDVASRLIDAFGGLEQYQSATAAYYARFYSDEERLAKTRQQLQDSLQSLGLSVPDTIAAYRDLVDAQDVTTESGRAAYVALLNLSGVFADVTAATEDMAATLVAGFTDIAKSLASLVDSIASERGKNTSAIASLTGPDAISAGAIRTSIDSVLASIVAPTSAGLVAAIQRKIDADSALVSASAIKVTTGDAAARVTSAQDLAQITTDTVAKIAADLTSTRTTLASTIPGWTRQPNNPFQSSYYDRNPEYDALVARVSGLEQQKVLATAAAASAAAALTQALATYGDQAAQNVAATNDYNAALAERAAAETAIKAAQIAYTVELRAYVLSASTGLEKLATLREKTLQYYEQQKALATLMANSAANLRAVMKDAAYGALGTREQQGSLQADFATAFALAQVSSGEQLAGYADQLAGTLPQLASSLLQTSGSSAEYALAVGRMNAQAAQVADKLDAQSPADFLQQSVDLLTLIDDKMAVLESTSQSAQALIVAAIDAGSDRTAEGLQQVINALQGNAVAAFASGGYHLGGLRIVGENGPELEATGPARIWNASDTRAMLAGGGQSQASADELRQLRADMRAAATQTAALIARLVKINEKWDGDGLPAARQESI
jgi:tape measure domain-containing protein